MPLILNGPLGYGGSQHFFNDVFGLKAKEKRKQVVKLTELSFQEKMAVERFEQEKAAVEGFRDRISAKLAEVEETANDAVELMERARKLAAAPELEGDPILEEFDARVSELETALVQIQTGTVVDTATFDTHRLAVSYSDAQAALIAMGGIKNRAAELSTLLSNRMEELELERRRQEELVRQRAQQEAERQRRLLKAEREAEKRRQEEELRLREKLARESRDLDREIRDEEREVQRLQRDLEDAQRRQASDAQRRMELAARRAQLSSQRRALQAG